MLKIATENKFKAVVTVHQPTERATYTNEDFHVIFKHVPPARREELLALDNDGSALLSEIVIGWENLVDANNQPIPFSPDMLKTILELDWIKIATVNAYTRAISNNGAKVKN